jgi:hypothetical protein
VPLAFRAQNGMNDRIWTRLQRENPRLMPGARLIIRSLKREFVLGIVTSGNSPECKQLRDFAPPIIFPRAFAAKTRQSPTLLH